MNTKVIAIIICALATAPALADTRDDVLAGVARCGVIHDDRVWLDCVYGAQQPMRAKLGLSPAPELQQRLVPGVNAVATPAPSPTRAVAGPPRKKQGFFDRILASTDMDAAPKMTAYRFAKDGGFVVTLENGQEYQQTDIEAGTVNWNRQPSTYRVVVSEAAFGGYTMRTSEGPRIFRVKRVH